MKKNTIIKLFILLLALTASLSAGFFVINKHTATYSILLNPQQVFAQTTPSFTFTAMGDIGKKTETDRSLQAVRNVGSAFTVALGDMSYSDAVPESAWCTYVKSMVGETHPFQIVMGNHEDDDRVDGHIDNFRACLPDRLNSTGTYGVQYYFDYPSSAPLARIIMINVGEKYGGVNHDYRKGSTYYNWLSARIDEARSQNIPWVIVGMHKVCVTVGSKPCEIGADIMNLLAEKRVDLVLHGHDHDYQRSKQLTCVTAGSFNAGCVVDDGSDGVYTKGRGVVSVIQGIPGGGGFTPVNPSDSEKGYFAKAMGGSGGYDFNTGTTYPGVGRGIMKYTVSQDRLDAQLVITTQTTPGTLFSDSFTITRDPNQPTTPPQPTATPQAQATPTPTPGSSCPTLPVNMGVATTSLTIPESGVYALWSRLMSSGSNNSYWLQIDNACGIVIGDNDSLQPSGQWTWVNYQNGNPTQKVQMNLTQGTHTIKLIGREAQVKLDALLLTSDMGCTPTGTGGNCTSSPTNTPTSQPPTVTTTPNTPTPTPTRAPTGTPVPTPTGTGVTRTLTTVADATVREGSPNTNYGSRTRLEVDGNSLKLIFMKYDLRALAGGSTVKNAKLRLYVVDSSSGRQSIVLMNTDNWSESSITYANRPQSNSGVTAVLNGGKTGNWVEVDVTNAVNARMGSFLSLWIQSSAENGLDFASKEAASNKPTLIIEQ